jgi:hypothetical protein
MGAYFERKKSGKIEFLFFVQSSVVKIPVCASLQTVTGNGAKPRQTNNLNKKKWSKLDR